MRKSQKLGNDSGAGPVATNVNENKTAAAPMTGEQIETFIRQDLSLYVPDSTVEFGHVTEGPIACLVVEARRGPIRASAILRSGSRGDVNALSLTLVRSLS